MVPFATMWSLFILLATHAHYCSTKPSSLQTTNGTLDVRSHLSEQYCNPHQIGELSIHLSSQLSDLLGPSLAASAPQNLEFYAIEIFFRYFGRMDGRAEQHVHDRLSAARDEAHRTPFGVVNIECRDILAVCSWTSDSPRGGQRDTRRPIAYVLKTSDTIILVCTDSAYSTITSSTFSPSHVFLLCAHTLLSISTLLSVSNNPKLTLPSQCPRFWALTTFVSYVGSDDRLSSLLMMILILLRFPTVGDVYASRLIEMGEGVEYRSGILFFYGIGQPATVPRVAYGEATREANLNVLENYVHYVKRELNLGVDGSFDDAGGRFGMMSGAPSCAGLTDVMLLSRDVHRSSGPSGVDSP